MIAFIILRQITAGIKLVTEQKMLPNRFYMQNALFIYRGLLSHSVLFFVPYFLRKAEWKKTVISITQQKVNFLDFLHCILYNIFDLFQKLHIGSGRRLCLGVNREPCSFILEPSSFNLLGTFHSLAMSIFPTLLDGEPRLLGVVSFA